MKLTVIEWVDSFGGGHWFHKDEFKPQIAECVTVGIVLAETPEYVTVTSTISENEDEQLYAPMSIPKCCIKKRKDFEDPRMETQT